MSKAHIITEAGIAYVKRLREAERRRKYAASGIVAATSGRDAQRLDERSEQSPVPERQTPNLPHKGASQ